MLLQKQKKLFIATGLLSIITVAPMLQAQDSGNFSGNEIEEIDVIGSTPLATSGIAIEDYAGNAQALRATDGINKRANDLSEMLINNLGSISVNTSQNNPYQNDIYYRGFLASPLVGSAIGLSVYMDGVRINEGFGDTINWDLVPSSAISTINIIPGSNPVFGLNTLGGALSVQTKSGNTFQGTVLAPSGGSWERKGFELEHGGYQDELEWYLLGNFEEEDGWRDESPTELQQLFGKIGWETDNTDIDLSAIYNDNDLTGNGFAPERLLKLDREASHTFPDNTINELTHLNLQLSHQLSNTWQLSGNAYYRDYQRETLNGDAEVECETDLPDLPGMDDRESGVFVIASADATIGAGTQAAAGADDLVASLCEDEVDDAKRELNRDKAQDDPDKNLYAFDDMGTEDDMDDVYSLLADDDELERGAEGEERTSFTDTETYGGSLQSVFNSDRYGQFILGFDYSRIDTRFRQTEAEGDLQRSGNSVGVEVEDAHETEADVGTEQENIGLYVTGIINISEPLTLNLSGRWQHADIEIRDLSGGNADLDGDHSFNRFMPAAGFTYRWLPAASFFINYSEGFRIPTAAELTCADENDPCNLPNAFVADPPLEPVIARTIELGARGKLANQSLWHIAAYRTHLDDDLLFITIETGGGGYFDNVGETQRYGLELGIRGQYQKLMYFADYSYVSATFEDDVTLSNVVEADGVQVQSGDDLPGIPNHNFRIGTEYQLMQNLWLGGNILASSGNYLRGDESNEHDKTDSYAVLNLNGRWQPHQNIEIWARIDNVLDKEYETAGARNLNANADIIFDDDIEEARFLAPGAPLAGWAGINITF